MRGTFFATGVTSMAVSLVAAQSPGEVPRYEVKRASAPMTIDGKLDEAAWGASPAVTLQFLWESQTGAKQMTRARLLWDAQALYVGFDAEDTDITARYEQRDDPTYRDDAVEILAHADRMQPKVADVMLGDDRLIEVDAKGEIVWEYPFPIFAGANASMRSTEPIVCRTAGFRSSRHPRRNVSRPPRLATSEFPDLWRGASSV